MKRYYNGKWDYEFDIVVAGFGGAGGCAAVEAHDAGAKVVLLEKQPEATHYSNTRMSGGGYHCPEKSGDREALKAYAKAMFSGENVPGKFEGDQVEFSDGLAEAWAEYAPYNTDFMCSLDPEFRTTKPNYGAAYPNFPGSADSGYMVCDSTYLVEGEANFFGGSPNSPKNKKEAGEAFHACILNGVNDRQIPIHYETSAVKLLHNEEGTIIGVKAEKDGKAVFYRANKAVILTTGGFEYNKKMRSAFLEGYGGDGWAFYGTPANTGDGIIMGMESGAALAKVGSAAGRLIASFPDFRADNGVRIGVSIVSIGRQGAIIVDNFGRRFCDERDISRDPVRYISYKHALAFDVHKAIFPRVPAWFVFDETLRTRKSITTTNITEYFGIPWSSDNHEPIDRGWILKADTIEELAEKINAHPDNHGQMEPAVLSETLKRYNEFCADGNDQDFHRGDDSLGAVQEAPYYALPLFPGGPNTKGGLKANEKRQIVDWSGNVIPRLYAAGEICSAFKYVYQSGGNVAECIVFGRVAGINAAKESSLD